MTNQEEEENYDSLEWSKSRGAGKAKNSTAKKNTAGQQLKHMSFISIKVHFYSLVNFGEIELFLKGLINYFHITI